MIDGRVSSARCETCKTNGLNVIIVNAKQRHRGKAYRCDVTVRVLQKVPQK